MTRIISLITALHERVFGTLERLTGGWFLGLFARFVFAAVLWGYFLNSAGTKVGDGLTGFFMIAPGAYYQIALPAVEAAGGDVDHFAFLPCLLIVTLGTYAEFVLPLLLVIGLFTRVAALGMIIFIGVQTLVDITVHMVDPPRDPSGDFVPLLLDEDSSPLDRVEVPVDRAVIELDLEDLPFCRVAHRAKTRGLD